MRRLTAHLAAALLVCMASAAAGETTPVMNETTLAVSGMVCSSCSAAVEKTLERLPGVAAAHADAKADRVSVRYDPKRVTLQQMVEALRKGGYRALRPGPPAPPARGLGH